MSAVGREILVGMLGALKEDPALAREIRELLGVAASAPRLDSEPIFMRALPYAARVGLSERTVWKLIHRGLPTVGKGRSRRVDVKRADVWLRNEQATVDDGVERSARESARRAAKAIR